MAMGHVILKEFFVDRQVARFEDYTRRFTDLPFLVTLREREDGTYAGDAFLRSSDLGATDENAEWRTVVLDERSGEPAVPNGTIGDRWGEQGKGSVAIALDWNRPARQQAATPFWYLATDQWRYETFGAEEFTSPAGPGTLGKRHTADCHSQAVRLGWVPASPTFDRNPLDLADEAGAAGREPADHVVSELRAGRLGFACDDPDDPANFPRVLTLWRANLLGSSSKGHEYSSATCSASPTRPSAPPSRRRTRARKRCAGATRRPRASSTSSRRSTSG